MSSATHERMLEAGDDNYQAVVSDGLVLLDFWAEWCGQCSVMDPILAQLVEKNPELTVATIDLEENETVRIAFDVQSLPPMVLFADGQQAERFVGQTPYVNLERAVQRHS